MSDAGTWFRSAPDAPWSATDFPMPDDLSENFAAISGKEAESLLMDAAASSSPAKPEARNPSSNAPV